MPIFIVWFVKFLPCDTQVIGLDKLLESRPAYASRDFLVSTFYNFPAKVMFEISSPIFALELFALT